MKKLLAVLVVVVLCLSVFTVQSFAESEDPFEIGKKLAGTGTYIKGVMVYRKETVNSASKFMVTHMFLINGVSFSEEPESGNGVRRQCSKYFDGPKYVTYKFVIKNGSVIKTQKESIITREEAEKEAWRILQYFGYTKQ